MTTNINVSDSGTGSGMARDYSGRKTVAGLFTDRSDAEKAINDLKEAGFRPEDVGVAMRDQTQQGEMNEEHGTKAAEGAGAGALGGGVLGGIVGLLVGIGALAIPGIGPVIAGGALATAFGVGGGTALAGAGIGAAAGGIVGALVGMGIPEEEAKHFEAGFREGGVLLTVNSGDRAMDALAILERNGADTGPGSVGSRAKTGATSGRMDDGGTKETAGGAVAGAGAGAVAGTAIGGPGVGTAVGAVVGGVTGAASGKAVHEARDPAERDNADEGAAGGGLAGGAAGAAIGTAVAGPAGTIPGAVIGGVAGSATGAGAGATQRDDDDQWTTDSQGNRVRRSSTDTTR